MAKTTVSASSDDERPASAAPSADVTRSMGGDGDCEGAGGAPTDRRLWTPPSGQEFGPAGWLLVCVLAIGLVGAPLAILLRPPGLPFEVAFLVLPLTPAVLLGAAAVWAALRGLEWG